MSDLNDRKAFFEFLEAAKDRGFATYDELNAMVPSDVLSGDLADEIFDQLDELNIRVISAEEAEKKYQYKSNIGVGSISKKTAADAGKQDSSKKEKKTADTNTKVTSKNIEKAPNKAEAKEASKKAEAKEASNKA